MAELSYRQRRLLVAALKVLVILVLVFALSWLVLT